MNAQPARKKKPIRPGSSSSKAKPPAGKPTGTRKSPSRKTPSAKLPKEIQWRVWLASEKPWMTVFALLVIIGSIIGLSIRFHPLYGFLAFLIFFAFLNPYFIPIKYTLNQTEIVIKKFYMTDRRDWKMFRRFFLTRSGFVLSTFLTRKKFLDNYRGIQCFLPKNKEQRAKILEYVESKVPLDSGQSLQ